MGLLLAASRRSVLCAATLLGAGPHGSGVPAAADEDLLAAVATFCALERRMRDLIEGPDRVADDDAREALLQSLRDAQAPHLDRLCRKRARSLAGHRARTAAFLAFDGGELAELADTNRLPADRMLAATIRDLVEAQG